MADENLKNLPAEERLKKLKELEKKKKQELAEAEKEIRESQNEITERKKWADKVPIPEVAKEELEGLSAEGKQLLRTHKGTKEKPKEDSSEKEEKEEKERKKEKQTSRGASKLEETLWQEKAARVPEAMNVEYGASNKPPFPGISGEYKPLSQQPTMNLYQEMNSMKQAIEEKGYISRADERKAEYLSGIVEERMKGADRGTYSFTEETARAASLTQRLGHSIRNAYQRGSSFEHDWYKGR